MQQLSPAKLTFDGCVNNHPPPNLDIYTVRDDQRVSQKSNYQSIFSQYSPQVASIIEAAFIWIIFNFKIVIFYVMLICIFVIFIFGVIFFEVIFIFEIAFIQFSSNKGPMTDLQVGVCFSLEISVFLYQRFFSSQFIL